MALRQFRENRTKVHTRTDQLVDVAHKIATEQLIPQIAQMSRNSVTVDRTEFYFYRRKLSGRRCSCFDTVETNPDGECQNCFQTGIVGGYDKYGCYEEILDATRPGLRLMNVRLAYELMRRPVFFVLDDGAKNGSIDFEMDVRPNVSLVDMIQLNFSLPEPGQSRVRAFIRTPDQVDFIPLSDSALSIALRSKKIYVQLRISRENSTVPSPLLRDVKLRYRLINQPRIIADIPLRQESIVLQEFGIYETNQQITMFIPDNPRKVGNNDFFIMVEEGTRWRVVESAPNRPSHQLTSNFLTCQNVPVSHPLYKFPV